MVIRNCHYYLQNKQYCNQFLLWWHCRCRYYNCQTTTCL